MLFEVANRFSTSAEKDYAFTNLYVKYKKLSRGLDCIDSLLLNTEKSIVFNILPNIMLETLDRHLDRTNEHNNFKIYLKIAEKLTNFFYDLYINYDILITPLQCGTALDLAKKSKDIKEYKELINSGKYFKRDGNGTTQENIIKNIEENESGLFINLIQQYDTDNTILCGKRVLTDLTPTKLSDISIMVLNEIYKYAITGRRNMLYPTIRYFNNSVVYENSEEVRDSDLSIMLYKVTDKAKILGYGINSVIDGSDLPHKELYAQNYSHPIKVRISDYNDGVVSLIVDATIKFQDNENYLYEDILAHEWNSEISHMRYSGRSIDIYTIMTVLSAINESTRVCSYGNYNKIPERSVDKLQYAISYGTYANIKYAIHKDEKIYFYEELNGRHYEILSAFSNLIGYHMDYQSTKPGDTETRKYLKNVEEEIEGIFKSLVSEEDENRKQNAKEFFSISYKGRNDVCPDNYSKIIDEFVNDTKDMETMTIDDILLNVGLFKHHINNLKKENIIRKTIKEVKTHKEKELARLKSKINIENAIKSAKELIEDAEINKIIEVKDDSSYSFASNEQLQSLYDLDWY